MQDKPNSSAGQSSTARTKRTSDPDKSGSSSPSASTNAASGASSSPADAGASSAGVIDQAKETISNVASQAGSKVASRLDMQKDRAADGLGSVAQTLRQTSDQLRDQDKGAAFQEYIASAADQVDRLSGFLRSTNVNQMINQVEQFARRQPALFLGGAFALGLIATRFLKSSSPANSARPGQYGSIPRSESLVPRSGYTATQTYGQGTGTGSFGSASPTDSAPIRRREDF
jgi:hypothetical protein